MIQCTFEGHKPHCGGCCIEEHNRLYLQISELEGRIIELEADSKSLLKELDEYRVIHEDDEQCFSVLEDVLKKADEMLKHYSLSDKYADSLRDYLEARGKVK